MKHQDVVYMLQCSDGTFYTGWTNNLEHRLKVHQEGKGAKYTKSRLPVCLIYVEDCADQREAMKREYVIKQMERADKLELIAAYKKENRQL